MDPTKPQVLSRSEQLSGEITARSTEYVGLTAGDIEAAARYHDPQADLVADALGQVSLGSAGVDGGEVRYHSIEASQAEARNEVLLTQERVKLIAGVTLYLALLHKQASVTSEDVRP